MDIRQLMKSKSISDSRSIENNSDKSFRSEFCSTSTEKWESRKRSCW